MLCTVIQKIIAVDSEGLTQGIVSYQGSRLAVVLLDLGLSQCRVTHQGGSSQA